MRRRIKVVSTDTVVSDGIQYEKVMVGVRECSGGYLRGCILHSLLFFLTIQPLRREVSPSCHPVRNGEEMGWERDGSEFGCCLEALPH